MKPTEVFESVYTGIKDRFVSPLYGPLIITWIIWNWKMFYLSFFVSEERLPYDRLTILEQYFFDNNWHLIYGPLITTAVVILVIPYLSNLVYDLSLWYDQEREKIRLKRNKKRSYSFDEFNQYFLKSEELETKYNELKIKSSESIERLEKIIKDSEDGERRDQINTQQLCSEAFDIYLKNKDDIKYFFNHIEFEGENSPLYKISDTSKEFKAIENKLTQQKVIGAVYKSEGATFPLANRVGFTKRGMLIKIFYTLEQIVLK